MKAANLVWDMLGKKSSQTFGKECASASLWMFCCLFLRCLFTLIRISEYIPNGFIFATPYLISALSKHFPILSISPLLPVRIAECVLGRLNPSRLSIIIPAHFIGSVFGAVVFKLICPFTWLEEMTLRPIDGKNDFSSSFANLILESICVAGYVIVVLVLPEMLNINRVSSKWTTLAVIPFFLLSFRGHQPTFHPSAVYALWYVQSSANRVASDQSALHTALNNESRSFASRFVSLLSTMGNSRLQEAAQLNIESLIGPLLGALGAGIICSMYFPDDPSSWKKSN